MSSALTWADERTGRARTDVVTLLAAMALHASALVLFQEPSEKLPSGAQLLNAPELEMAMPEESVPNVEPSPEAAPPEAPPGPELRAPKPQETPAEEVPVTEVSEGAPQIENSEATQEQEVLAATENVLVDESSKGSGFSVRTSEQPRGGAATGKLHWKKQEASPSGERRATQRRPRAPKYPAELDTLVLRNYPHYARSEGVESNVVAHVKLSAGGKVLNVRVADVSDDGWGFGEACARSIHQLPMWQPKLDDGGRPVATVAAYACRFVHASE